MNNYTIRIENGKVDSVNFFDLHDLGITTPGVIVYSDLKTIVIGSVDVMRIQLCIVKFKAIAAYHEALNFSPYNLNFYAPFKL